MPKVDDETRNIQQVARAIAERLIDAFKEEFFSVDESIFSRLTAYDDSLLDIYYLETMRLLQEQNYILEKSYPEFITDLHTIVWPHLKLTSEDNFLAIWDEIRIYAASISVFRKLADQGLNALSLTECCMLKDTPGMYDRFRININARIDQLITVENTIKPSQHYATTFSCSTTIAVAANDETKSMKLGLT
jgi:hypothetical protein